jgi:tetratricopeptide (TPR) repeat protein
MVRIVSSDWSVRPGLSSRPRSEQRYYRKLRVASKILTVAIWAAAVLSSQTADSDAIVRRDLEAAESAMRSGQLEEAEKHFLKIAAMRPQELRAHVNLGVIYMRQKNWKRALEELRTAEKLAPQIPGIRFDIGLVYYRQGKYHEAIAPFESVLRDKPDWTQARHLLGLCYLSEERFADAATAFESLWTGSNSDLSYLYVLAVAAGSAGRHDLEERALARLLEVGEKSASLHLLFGKTYLSGGDDEKALSELDKAAANDPKLPMVHYNLGIVYKRRHDYEKAKEEFLKDVAVEPDVAVNYDELGTISLDLEQNDEAQRYFEEALKRNSQLPASWYGLAKIERAAKRYPQALKALDSACALAPKSASAHYLRAQTLMQLGRKAEAETEFAIVRRLHQETVDKLEQQIMGGAYRDPQLAAEPK